MERKLGIIIITLAVVGCAAFGLAQGGNSAMKLTSPAFKDNEFIPEIYTCQGADVNPPLVIEGSPAGAKTFVLIVDDPDAPMGTWVHWVVFDIPPMEKIDENSAPGKQGSNDFGRTKYGGPCPPSGTHRYFFKLFALDTSLELPSSTGKEELEQAMAGHILAKAELIGLYTKSAGRR